MDILKSENPQEAILTILYEKVVNKDGFNMMVAKAEKETEKVPTTLVEALDIIDEGKPNFGRQYPKRRKGKRESAFIKRDTPQGYLFFFWFKS